MCACVHGWKQLDSMIFFPSSLKSCIEMMKVCQSVRSDGQDHNWTQQTLYKHHQLGLACPGPHTHRLAK